MKEIQINDWVEVLKPNLTHYFPTASVAHYGRVIETGSSSSKVIIEIWGRPNSCTNYFPLEFKNSMLKKV